MQPGFPAMSLENGKRVYKRSELQPPGSALYEESVKLPGEEKINQNVYLIYGSAHDKQAEANIVYKPVKFTGTLPPYYDPTKPEDFNVLKTNDVFRSFLGSPRDITLKVFYEDGSVLHVINPHHGYDRSATYDWGFHIWRTDVCSFSLVVPGDKKIIRVELYRRPLVVRDPSDPIDGNIANASQNITAENFMEGAVFQDFWELGKAKKPGSNTIGNRVWNDLNRNGKDDFSEPGIANVKILLWGDSNGDAIPDSEKFMGVSTTDENGYYSFGGLKPGHYLPFVWFLENWDEGRPLHGMVSSIGDSDPNNDIDKDDNGRPGYISFPGLGQEDFASGTVTLTADGEPLGDGDRIDEWFDYDISGNMTVDFGFYNPEGCPVINTIITAPDSVCADGLGVLHAEVVSGDGPYTVKWSKGIANGTMAQLSPGTYTVEIKNNKGCTATETIVIQSASNCSTTSTAFEESANPIFYPNPFTNQLQIGAKIQEKTTLEVWNVMGQRVMVEGIQAQQETVRLRQLPAGIYLMVLKNALGKILFAEKLINE